MKFGTILFAVNLAGAAAIGAFRGVRDLALGNLEAATVRRPLPALAVAALLGAILTVWMLT